MDYNRKLGILTINVTFALIGCLYAICAIMYTGKDQDHAIQLLATWLICLIILIIMRGDTRLVPSRYFLFFRMLILTLLGWFSTALTGQIAVGMAFLPLNGLALLLS